MYRNYLEVTLPPWVDHADWNFILNKVVNRLHGVLRSSGFDFGLDFPDITSEADSPNGLGKKLRIFGKTEELEQLLQNTGIRDMVDKHMIIHSELTQVPDKAQEYRVSRVRQLGRRALAKKVQKQIAFLRNKGVQNNNLPSFEELKRRFTKTDNPFLLIERGGKTIPVFFTISKMVSPENPKKETPGNLFSTYGLSSCNDGVVYRF